MDWDRLCVLGRELPEVETSVWYRTPSLAVRGKSFVRLLEDAATVVFLTEDLDERDALLAARPHVYFITDHYRASAAVLAPISKLAADEARQRLEQAWRKRAPKALVRRFDARPRA